MTSLSGRAVTAVAAMTFAAAVLGLLVPPSAAASSSSPTPTASPTLPARPLPATPLPPGTAAVTPRTAPAGARPTGPPATPVPSPSPPLRNAAVTVVVSPAATQVAAALQVRRLHGPGVALTNEADAAVGCDRCVGIAIAVQVALVKGRVRNLSASNVSRAVTSRCTKCRALSVAVQVVAVAPTRIRLSRKTGRMIRTLDRRLRSLQAGVTVPPVTDVAREVSLLSAVLEQAVMLDLRRSAGTSTTGRARPKTGRGAPPAATAFAHPTPSRPTARRHERTAQGQSGRGLLTAPAGVGAQRRPVVAEAGLTVRHDPPGMVSQPGRPARRPVRTTPTPPAAPSRVTATTRRWPSDTDWASDPTASTKTVRTAAPRHRVARVTSPTALTTRAAAHSGQESPTGAPTLLLLLCLSAGVLVSTAGGLRRDASAVSNRPAGAATPSGADGHRRYH